MIKRIIGLTILTIFLLCIQLTTATTANAVVKGWTPPEKEIVSIEMNVDSNPDPTTNPSNNTGGKISAREVVLTDPITGSQSTLNYATSGGVSRARVFFTNM